MAEPNNVVDFPAPDYSLEDDRDYVTTQALRGLDADPDQVGESEKIGAAMSLPGSVVSLDPDNYKRQLRSQLTSDFFENNAHLREYVRAHPIGAKLSNDDWGQLDLVSQKMDAFSGGQTQLGKAVNLAGAILPGPVKEMVRGMVQQTVGPESLAGAATRGFVEGYGPEPLADLENKDQISKDFAVANPEVYNLIRQGLIYSGIDPLIETPLRLFTGAVRAVHSVTKQGAIRSGMSDADAEGFANEVAGMLEVAPFHSPGHGVPHGMPEAAKPRVEPRLGITIPRKPFPGEAPPGIPEPILNEASNILDWAKAGRAPPVRIGPLTLDLAKQDARDSLKAFNDIYKEIQGTATLPRDGGPEAITKFSEVRYGDSTIGISAEKARELYGDGTPTVGDNKLGWISGIEEQYEAAVASGRDITVPIKDFLARATPEVMEVVKDGLRLNHDGLTIDETRDPSPKPVRDAFEEEFGKPYVAPKEAPQEAPQRLQPHQVLRKAAGLEPEYAKGWEISEGGTDQKFVELPETGEPGQTVKVISSPHEAKSLSSFPLKDLMPKLNFDALPEDAKLLSEFWGKRLNELAGDVPVHVIDREDFKKMYKQFPNAAGVYGGGFHHIVLPHDVFRFPDWMTSQVVLHEAAHAISVQELAQFPELKAGIRRLMEEVKDFHRVPGESLLKIPALDDFKYAFTNEKEFISEAVANPGFRRVLMETPVSDTVAKGLGLGEKTGTIWDAVKNIFKDLWSQLTGKVPEQSVMDAFFRIAEHLEEANKILERMGEDEAPSFAPPPEDLAKSPFAKAAFDALTQKRLEGFLKLLKKQQDEDVKAKRDFEQAQEGKRATQEWKDNEPRVREEAKADIYRRRDVAADRFLRLGEMPNGTKVKKLKIDPGSISPEFRRELPEYYLSPNGVHPDDLAGAFGYQSGDQMVRDLVRLEMEREAEDVNPASFIRSMVNKETQRRMQEQYGVSAKDIISRAEERVVNPTARDLLITELQTLEPTITRKTFEDFSKRLFDRLPQDTHNYMTYINAMGREGQKAEDALMEGRVTDWFEAKQHQAMLSHHAFLTKQLEKTRDQAQRFFDRYSPRQPGGSLSPLHTNAIQNILLKVTDPGFASRTPEDIASQWNKLTDKTFREWVAERNQAPTILQDPDAMPMGQIMNVEDFLQEPDFSKSWKEMTPPELRALLGSLKSIEKDGREEHLIEVRGKKEEKKEVISGLIQRLRDAVAGKKTSPDSDSVLRTIGSLLLTPETWFLRLDLGNDHGPFSQLITRKIIEGQYDRALLEKEFAAKWRDIGNFGDLREKIENRLFMDPLTNFQSPLEMTKGHLWAVLANMGNKEQRRKLAGGYGIKNPDSIWTWLQQHGVTEEHIARAQKMGDFFSELYDHSENMYTELAGWAGERIPLGKVQTPWGEIDEWYHPLIPDPIRHSGLKASDMMDETGFRYPMPTSGYTKKRTGAIYPVQLNFDAIPTRIKQMINDIAMRPAIHEVGKVILDKDFRNNFTLYYGKEYTKQLTEWLRDSAGVAQYTSAKESAVIQGINFIRQNMTNLLIGMNIGTIAKHVPTAAIFSALEVDPVEFAKNIPAGGSVALPEAYRMERANLAIEKSAELQTRRRQVREGIQAANEDLFQTLGFQSNYWKAREWSAAIGTYPIATMDLVFSTALWLTKYDDMMKKGFTDADAIYSANTAVRRTHGSTLIAAKPALMRAHPMIQAFLPFYNFFNNALQRNYEAAWKAKLSLQGRTLSEMRGFEKEQFDKGLKNLAPALGGLALYAIIPSIIEQIVDPIPTDDDESTAKWGAKVISRAPLAMIPGVRDVANYMLEGRDPAAGIIGSFFRTGQGAWRDVSKALTDEDWDPDPAKTIRHFNTAIGALAGLVWAQPTKTGEFIYNYMNDREDPENIGQWWRGIRTGKSQEERRR